MDLVLAVAIAVGLGLAFMVGYRRGHNDAEEGAATDTSPDDAAPTTDATWTCPECDQAVPVTITAQHANVMRLDPTDAEAHLLQHQEAP